MNKLLKKATLTSNPTTQESLKRVNISFINAPMFIIHDSYLPLDIAIATCNVGVGAMHQQGKGVISYEP